MTITLTREEAQQLKESIEDLTAGDEIDLHLIETLRTALAQPEPGYRDVVIKGDLWRIEFLPDHAASVVLVRANYEAQPELEPVAWRFDQARYRENDLRGRRWAFNVFSQTKPYMDEMVRNVTPLYTAPPQHKEWQGLTDAERMNCETTAKGNYVALCAAIEAKLKYKNT